MEDFLVFRKPVFYQTAGKESAVGRRRRWEVYPAQRIYVFNTGWIYRIYTWIYGKTTGISVFQLFNNSKNQFRNIKK
ncbi:hypothetical protein DWY69_26465 [Eisenbergiella massiliensis]|uniref:Uncharacterized protein n=1 Tax=Eisenbergiella massiliensis TaxID=1720294 RepID=A0A3E3I9C5_9FIRM|nr:hypothetical protein DXC51_06695 [Eisenbergiella massiliensis]RGE64734.1 hypothetical protein DWY69_26465 [Eisenbergiella massiliensis]